MENISTGLKWAIGLIVTLLIVAAGISVYMISNGNFKRGQEQAVSQSASLAETEFTLYDNTSVSGSDVLDAVKRFQGRPEFSITVKTGKATAAFYVDGFDKCYADSSGVATATGTCGTKVTYSQMTDQSTEQYVNTTARFKSKVFKDKNGIVRLITLTQNI